MPIYGECVNPSETVPVLISELRSDGCDLAAATGNLSLDEEWSLWIGAIGPLAITLSRANKWTFHASFHCRSTSELSIISDASLAGYKQLIEGQSAEQGSCRPDPIYLYYEEGSFQTQSNTEEHHISAQNSEAHICPVSGTARHHQLSHARGRTRRNKASAFGTGPVSIRAS